MQKLLLHLHHPSFYFPKKRNVCVTLHLHNYIILIHCLSNLPENSFTSKPKYCILAIDILRSGKKYGKDFSSKLFVCLQWKGGKQFYLTLEMLEMYAVCAVFVYYIQMMNGMIWSAVRLKHRIWFGNGKISECSNIFDMFIASDT